MTSSKAQLSNRLDELRIRHLQFGFVIREKLLVVLNGVLGAVKFFS